MKITTSIKILSLLLVLLLCPTVFAPLAINTDAADGEVSVSISWTNMSFTYIDGAWDPATHTYAAGSWQPVADGGKITVTNNGTSSLRFSFSYSAEMDYSGIRGQFTYNGSSVSSVDVAPKSSSVVNFTPTEAPTSTIKNAKIGTITVSVGPTSGTAKININGNSIGDFRIIYSDADLYAAKVFAYRLQDLLSTTYKYTNVNVFEDNSYSSNNANAKEIVIGDTNRGSKNSSSTDYSIVTADGKLYIRSPKSVGYDYIYNALKKEFEEAKSNLNYKNGDNYVKPLSEVLDDGAENALGKTGDIRIMFNNVLIFNERADTTKTYKTTVEYRAKQLAAIYKDYMPDVLGLQEFGKSTENGKTYNIRTQITNLISGLGYTEVSYNSSDSNSNSNGQTALFYNKNTVNLITSGFYAFPAASNGVYQADRGIAWGLFTDKATGSRFIVASTHFVWAEDTAERLSAARNENANFVVSKLNNLSKKYPEVPIFIGGDFNSRASEGELAAKPLNTLAQNGFTNVVLLATKAEAQDTHHGYPSFDNGCVANVYDASHISTNKYTYKNALDHIFAYDPSCTNIQCNTQAVLNDFLSITSSDHCPILLDFSFTKDPTSGKK